MGEALTARFWGGPYDGRVQEFPNAGPEIEFPAYAERDDGDPDFYSVKYVRTSDVLSGPFGPHGTYYHVGTPEPWRPK